jgi:hypothetical protein
MVRLQIQLETGQHRQVKRRARRLGVSVAEVIRRCLDAQLRAEAADESGQRARQLLSVAGKYTDARTERHVAANHDAALGEAFRQ